MNQSFSFPILHTSERISKLSKRFSTSFPRSTHCAVSRESSDSNSLFGFLQVANESCTSERQRPLNWHRSRFRVLHGRTATTHRVQLPSTKWPVPARRKEGEAEQRSKGTENKQGKHSCRVQSWPCKCRKNESAVAASIVQRRK